MNTIQITDMAAFKAAYVCAARKDVRPYLNGIMIDTTNNSITGSDGRRLFNANAVDCAEYNGIDKPIIQLGKTIPATAESGYLDMDDKIAHFFNKKFVENLIRFDIVEDQYPDFSRVFKENKPFPTDKFGVHSKYLADIEKSVNEPQGTEIKIYGNSERPVYLGLRFPLSDIACDYKAVVMLLK